MKPHVVPDTSVVIKWFRQGEVLAPQALMLRRAYLEGRVRVSVPPLLAYELANVLRYKDDLTTDQVEEAVQSLFDLDLEWIPLSVRIMRRTAAIAREHDVTVYDAAFVALAEALNADLVTADAPLARRLTALPFVRFLGDVEGEGGA